MDYTIPPTTLKGKIEMEVALAADDAYSDNGTSLYESVALFSKDNDLVLSLIGDAARTLVRMLDDIAVMGTTSGSTPTATITFSVPDNPSADSYQHIVDEIDRFIVNYVCNEIFKQRRAVLVPAYTARVQTSFDNVNALLRQRTAPTRTTSSTTTTTTTP